MLPGGPARGKLDRVGVGRAKRGPVMPLDQGIEYIASACPYDCPSTCALEVERLDGRRIGRVRGAAAARRSGRSRETTRRREARPTALLHPEDLAAMAVGEGQAVRLGNPRGSVVVHAARFDGLQRGVVVVESVWPNRDFVEGIGVNALIGADAVAPRGGAAFHDTAVWIRPA